MKGQLLYYGQRTSVRESGSLYSEASKVFAGEPCFAEDKRQLLVFDLEANQERIMELEEKKR